MSPALSRGAAALVLACGLLTARPALARTPEQLFEDGRKAMDRKDYAAACPAFRRSFEASDSKGALYNLARCEDEGRAGHLATALKLWKYVRDRFGDQPDVISESERRIGVLEAKVARIIIKRAAGAPREMRVELDGQLAPLEVSIPVDAGKHSLSATAEGHASQRVEILLRDGDGRTVDLDPGRKLAVTTTVVPAAASAPNPPPPDEPEQAEEGGTSTWTTAGFVVGGAGVVGLVLFAVSAPIILGAESELDDVCPSRTNCPPSADEAAARGEAWIVPNAIGLVTGVLGVGLGVTFLVIGSQDEAAEVGVRGDRIEVRGSF